MTDAAWSELCRCKSLSELRLKAVVLGVDEDEQLAWLWLPRDDGGHVLWYERDEVDEARID